MRDYKRILVGTDFSKASMEAALRGADLAKRYGAKATTLPILSGGPEEMDRFGADWVKQHDNRVRGDPLGAVRADQPRQDPGGNRHHDGCGRSGQTEPFRVLLALDMGGKHGQVFG